jgi:periplasmic divalent cation tolerance protein
MKEKMIVVLSTCPDEATAARLARCLIDEELAACVSRVPGVRSTYRWEGRIQEDGEVLLVIKTIEPILGTLTARIAALHPYEVPEVIAIPVAGGSERYLDWVGQSVASPGGND